MLRSLRIMVSCTEGLGNVRGSVDPRFGAGSPILCPTSFDLKQRAILETFSVFPGFMQGVAQVLVRG